MAALTIGQIQLDDVKNALKVDAVFTPKMDETVRKQRYEVWKEAVGRSLKWMKYGQDCSEEVV